MKPYQIVRLLAVMVAVKTLQIVLLLAVAVVRKHQIVLPSAVEAVVQVYRRGHPISAEVADSCSVLSFQKVHHFAGVESMRRTIHHLVEAGTKTFLR